MATHTSDSTDSSIMFDARPTNSTIVYDVGLTNFQAGRPLRTVPIDSSWALSPGDHILYLINDNQEYRQMFRSALVENISKEVITIIVNLPHKGVVQLTQEFGLFKSLHKVDYSVNAFPGSIAVENAQKRLGENCHHVLYNNSHHVVTKAKTGLEYSLADIISIIQDPWSSDYELKPVLVKSTLQSIEDIKPEDHITDNSNHHWLVESVDTGAKTFKAFTCSGKHVCCETKKLKDNLYKLKYPKPVNPDTVHIPCGSETPIQKARTEIEKKTEWKESDKFVTKMKCGKSFAISEASLLQSSLSLGPVSCTRVTPHVMLDQGDHLLVKTGTGYRSVLVEAILNASTVICMPAIVGTGVRGDMVIAEREVYRVNYAQHLPPDEIIHRAESSEGQRLLRKSLEDQSTSLFVSWAVSGRSFSVNGEKMTQNQQLKMILPTSYQHVTELTCSLIRPGDHLFVDHPYQRYRWHFMVTEVCAEPNTFKTVYCFNGSVKETVEKVDPKDSNVYKVIYLEEFEPEIAIRKARSKVGDKNMSLWARVDFVRWAKTGSQDGVEVDVMTNNSTPSSKSTITSFHQLNPGDYLVIEESTFSAFHHCLVADVTFSESCTVFEVWNRTVTKTALLFNKGYKYFRLNYNPGVCRPAKQSIEIATSLLKPSTVSNYSRQRFVNFLKTGEDEKQVDVNSLQDDRILLTRERVQSAIGQLKKGDHIERPLSVKIPGSGDYCHHMFVLKAIDDRQCEVVHSSKTFLGREVRKEIVDIFQEGKVSRVKYPECIDPDEGTATLLQLADMAKESSQAKQTRKLNQQQEHKVLSNNCEHIVMLGTIGQAMSIQVDVDVYQCLHQHVHAVPPGLNDALVKATLKGGTKTVAKVSGAALIWGVKAAAKEGGVAVAHHAMSLNVAESSLAVALQHSFHVGSTAALSAATLGFVQGIALGTNVLIESPLLVRSLYKVHRKKKFKAISSTAAKRQATMQVVGSVNTVAGGIGGAIVGQIAIPVPLLGAAVGSVIGVIAGKGFGYMEGKLASALLFADEKGTDLPVIIHCVYISDE